MGIKTDENLDEDFKLFKDPVDYSLFVDRDMKEVIKCRKEVNRF